MQSQGGMIKWFLKKAARGQAKGQPGVCKSFWTSNFKEQQNGAVLRGKNLPSYLPLPTNLSLVDTFCLINGTFSLVQASVGGHGEKKPGGMMQRWEIIYVRWQNSDPSVSLSSCLEFPICSHEDLLQASKRLELHIRCIIDPIMVVTLVDPSEPLRPALFHVNLGESLHLSQ